MSDRMEAVLAVVTGVADAIENVRHGQDRLQKQVSTLAEAQDKLRGDVMARLDRLQNGQQQMRDEVAVNYAADEQIGKRLDNGDEQTRLLREQVNLMHRMLRQMDERLRSLEYDRDSASGGR